jgi:uncharacterized membrane protein YedE/YeeE
MNSLAGFAGYLGHVAIDWRLVLLVSMSAIVGSVIGGRLAGRVPQERLRRAFAWLVAAIGVLMVTERLPEVLGARVDWTALAMRGWSRGLMLSGMESFTPIESTVGGILIGLASMALLLGLGRIAGVSGIFAGVLIPRTGEAIWRIAFVVGLVAGGLVMATLAPRAFAVSVDRSFGALALAGLLVGFGTRLGHGCTSGHGVCGLSRLSPRSLVATVSFMLTGGVTVFFVQHVLGGVQ